MRWHRPARRRSERAHAEALAGLELGLAEPQGHTRALVAAGEEPESPEYARAVAALERWPPRRWLALDAVRLDAWTWYADQIGPRGGWSALVRRPDASTLLVVLAATHEDGYLRERATELLARRTGPLVSAALAVRAVDHVPQVREVARRALDARRAAADAGAVVPILLAALRRDAAAGALERYVEGLGAEPLRSLAGSQDTETRRFAIDHAALTAGELVRIAASDGDIRARLAAARRAVSEDDATAEELLDVRPATVQALAVSVAAGALVRPRLDQLLLDRSAHLRRAAQERARALGIDAAAVYRSRLPARAAVLGLGETGSAGDADRVTPLVGHEHAAPVRRAAIRALGRLASRELLLALLPPLLESDQPSLAREAARQLRRVGFTLTGAKLDRALAGALVWTRQAALGIALGGGGWDAPVAALALYGDEDEGLRESARSALAAWLVRRAPTAGTPTAEQADRLRALLERADLAPEADRLVRFHAVGV